MGTLIKCYKPLFSTQLSSFPNSARTIRLNAHRARPFFKPTRFFASSVAQNLRGSAGGETTEIPLSSELWLHNTMSRKKEAFRPKVKAKVGMYVCGVTAYDLSHVGHARVYVTFDVLYRYLRHLGYQVCYVRNFTTALDSSRPPPPDFLDLTLDHNSLSRHNHRPNNIRLFQPVSSNFN